MPTVDDVARAVRDLPEVTEAEGGGKRSWAVAGKTFAWVRAFSKADLKRYGDHPVPQGPILAVRVEDLHEKEGLLAEGLPGFFTIPHFANYAAVLVQLSQVTEADLREALVGAWLTCAPRALARRYLAEG